MTYLLIVSVFFLLAGLQALGLAWFGLRGFSYERSFSKPAAYEGESVELIEVIQNRSPFFLPWVRVETSIPPSFSFSTREAVEVRGGHFHTSVFTLAPFSRVTRRHHVTLTRRGHYALQQASITAGDLMGMRTLLRDVEAPAEISVWPRLFPDLRYTLPSSRSQGDLSVRRWIQPDPFLVNGIRAYRTGDPERDIHWAATARVGALQVKTHDFTADPRLMVLINGQKSESQWGDLMDYEQEPIEYAISLAATLCLDALRRGQEAGFAASMPLDEGEECVCMLPGRRAGWEEALLSALAALSIRMVRTFSTFLDQLPRLSGADIVILSCYDSPDIKQKMRQLRLLGNSVTLRLLPEVRHASA